MFFKNAQVYNLSSAAGFTVEALQAALSARSFKPCGSQDMASRGWASPTKDDRMVLSIGGHLLICLKIEKKLLPTSVVNEVAAEKAEIIQAQQGFKPGRKQMKEIKEAVLQELLPKAFSRRTKVFAWIDTANRRLVIDAPSPTRAEDILDALRDTLDELPVQMLKTNLSPVSVMTGWLASRQATGGFNIDQDCELRAVTDEKAAVRYVHHALDGDDVKDHLQAGKLPTRIALTFNDRISFVLTEKMEIKRLAFLDIIKEEAERQAESSDMQMEADLALMGGELSAMIAGLIEVLGGEVAVF